MLGALLLACAPAREPTRDRAPLRPRRFDYVLAFTAMFAGIGFATGDWAESVFLVGFGAAQVALTASTRLQPARGASRARPTSHRQQNTHTYLSSLYPR